MSEHKEINKGSAANSMTNRKKIGFSVTMLLAISSLLLFQTQCKNSGEDFAPSMLPQATVKGITANNGGSLYCSISGGCPITIQGSNFFPKAKVFVGPYECLNTVVTETEINCEVGPAQNGVYDITIKNVDGQPHVWDSSVTDPSSLRFSYASFLYLGSQETPGKVYGYAQNPETGALLSIIGSPFSISGHNATYGVVIHPNNKFIYSANVSTHTISVYSIDPLNGRLTAVGAPVDTAATGTNGLFFHPSGHFLYATNQSSNSVSAFSVAANGTLTEVAGSPFPTTGASSINGVVVSSDGKFLYAAAMGGNGGVVGFTIDQDTGALTLIPGSPFINTLGGDTTNPGDGITIHPNAQWLYMGLVNLKKVSGWSINQTTGELTPIQAPVLNNDSTGYTDNGGSASTVSKDGRFLYGTAYSTNGTHPKKIIVYAIDQVTGELTRSSEADTGGGPNDVRLDTNGLFAYTCNSLNPPSVSAFSVNSSTGVLTALAPRDYTIPTANGGPGIMVMQRNILSQSLEE